MPRKPNLDIAPRTVRVHVPTYNHILHFFRLSPAGITGADAIRQILYKFGKYCEEQQATGRPASAQDLTAAEDIVYRTLGQQQGESDDEQ